MRHSATYRGKRVLLELTNGTRRLTRFLDRKGGTYYFEGLSPLRGRQIERMIISPAVMRAKGVL